MWKEYFEDMLKTMQEQEEENETIAEQDQHIKIEEVEEAITKVTSGKAAGHDNEIPEMIKKKLRKKKC